MGNDADTKAVWLDDGKIEAVLAGCRGREDQGRVREVLAKAGELKGLSLEDVAALMGARSPDLTEELFAAARTVKEEIYGNRIVLFAPLYISNICSNDCLYCAFRKSNSKVTRRTLTMDEIAEETRILLSQGHKRVLMVAGEAYPGGGIGYVLDAIDAIYVAREGGSSIRRVNVNLAPLSVEDFRLLKAHNIGTFQLFQETYHRPTYKVVHPSGPKRDLDWRASSFDRAMLAGIDDVGMGILFGLYDWQYETLALMMHIAHLEERFGVGCHTISVPRIEPAIGSELASQPPHAMSDEDFLRLVAILRLAVPYTGLIMSTREDVAIRNRTLELGVSQISANSRVNPGGYKEDRRFESAQFQLGDARSLAEVVRDLGDHGFIPSFCTGCYRLGRTGKDFMDLAKPGLIKDKCAPNALSTFEEYLLDYAAADDLRAGETAIDAILAGMEERPRRVSEALLAKVRSGQRDVYC
ncbi:MAG: [FeFe] hydrogenase H-cluster radical SAM maturase HydG [Desulfovibrio sp.]|jgi:2-iminoacetate synthase|nr:[FeFe] hydrogenase H-cluster radical SAM maturase HydG [Desulfovibrio sp.]